MGIAAHFYSDQTDLGCRTTVVSKGVIEPPTGRDKLMKAVKDIYYNVDDAVWSTWSDAKLQTWLVEQKILGVPQAANLKRHELEKLVADNYHKAADSLPSLPSWQESDMRAWLIKNNYIKSDAQVKKDEVSRARARWTLAALLTTCAGLRSPTHSRSTTMTSLARPLPTCHGATLASVAGSGSTTFPLKHQLSATTC